MLLSWPHCKTKTAKTRQHKTTRGKVRNKTFSNTAEQDLGFITKISIVLHFFICP